MTQSSFILLAPLSLLLSASSFAQQQSFKIDPAKSDVSFSLGATGHQTHGTFQVQSGAVSFNPSAAKMSGKVVVTAMSGKTGNDKRDEKMWNEVLDAPHFTDVTFAPQSYEGKLSPDGDSTIQVSGIFTLHGTPHQMTVPMQVHIQGMNCVTKTHFVVPYVQWGLKDPSVFILKVAKEVDVDLTLAGELAR